MTRTFGSSVFGSSVFVPATSTLVPRPTTRSRIRRLLGIMRTLTQDLRYAVRMLLRAPGFTLVAVLTLGLGIGAATAIFSIVNGVLVRPLSYREPSRVMNFWVDFGVGAQSLPAMNPGDFKDYQQRTQLFESIAAASGGNIVGATGALSVGDAVHRV